MEDELIALLDTYVETAEVSVRDAFGKTTGTSASIRHRARVQWQDDLIRDPDGRETPVEGLAYLDTTASDIAVQTVLTFADGRSSVVRKVWKVNDENGLHHVKVAYGR